MSERHGFKSTVDDWWRFTEALQDVPELDCLVGKERKPVEVALVLKSSASEEDFSEVLEVLRRKSFKVTEEEEGSRRCLLEITLEGLEEAAESASLRKRNSRGAVTPYKTAEFKPNGLSIRYMTSPEEELILIRHALFNIKPDPQPGSDKLKDWREDESLIHFLRRIDVVEAFFPMHDRNEANQIMSTLTWKNPIPTFSTICKVQGYFGDYDAVYYAFLTLYVNWLVFLACGGLVFGVSGLLFPLRYRALCVCAYSAYTYIWASRYLDIWQRKNSEMTYLWHHCLPNDALVQFQFSKAEINERHATNRSRGSQKQAKLVEFGSWCSLALYLIGSCFALHYSLELAKVVAKFVEDTPSIESLLSFKDREELIQMGFMFAKSQGLLQVPTIVYIAALNILEVGYNALTKAVTNYESHELMREHENVLFLRQMLYKLLCKNVSYFYLAFYKSEFEELLKALLLINVLEMVATVLKQVFVQGLYRYKLHGKVSREGQMKKDESQTHANKSPILEEMELSEAAAADVMDYSRITSQFGQLVLFAAALPFGAVGAFIGNYFQVYTELFAAFRTRRRNFPRRALSIGSVQYAFTLVCMASMAVNLGLILFTSKLGDHVIGDEIDSVQEFLVIIMVEHVLLVIQYILSSRAKTLPNWIEAEALTEKFVEEYSTAVGRLKSSTTASAAESRVSNSLPTPS
ncbi:hypothetical protein NDN08_000675 [Rhodosorus marinus]|uniref:Anoctamin transmembrane domain-containing protein n=1 Tax=Rhodosorus marinus TaxID=101924 RepID=A0AAV8USW0_9RHOD|nr:hypothetical protein NDN08_000675 [Rhodosorus marinus]